MRNSHKAGLFFASLLAGVGAISLAFAPAKPAASLAPVVIDLPEMVIEASPSPRPIVLDEITIEAPVKARRVERASSGRQTSYHVLSQGGAPDRPLVLVHDSQPDLSAVMTRRH